MEEILFKIIIGLACALVGLGGFFGYFVNRLIKGYDKQLDDLCNRTKDLPVLLIQYGEQIQELFHKTNDIPSIKESIAWIKRDIDKIK